MPRSVKASLKSTPESNYKEKSMSSRIESLTIQEDVKEAEVEDEEGLPIYPYERLKVNSSDPATKIDVTKQGTYQLSLGRNLGWQKMSSMSCPNGSRISLK